MGQTQEKAECCSSPATVDRKSASAAAGSTPVSSPVQGDRTASTPLPAASPRPRTSLVQEVSAHIAQAEGHPTVRVFKTPTTSAKVIGEINSNTRVCLDALHSEAAGSFCRVKYGSLEGWVGAKNVKIKPGVVFKEVRKSTKSGEAGSEGISLKARPLRVVQPKRADEAPEPEVDVGTATTDTVSIGGRYRSPDRSVAVSVYTEVSEPVSPTSLTDHLIACPLGTKCKRRDNEHLAAAAHPFDPDYAHLCACAGMEVEEPSLLGLFQWVDVDGSGKVSRKELADAFPMLSILMKEKMVLTDKAWERLDEDGNGCVNFSEFSCWAGPRLGLPLGVSHLFKGKAVDECHGCAVIGCPCEAFEKKKNAKTLKDAYKPHRSPTADFMSSSRGLRNLELCKCGHKFSAHNMSMECEGEVPYPLYWDARDSSGGDFVDLVAVHSGGLELFQKLFDATYRPVWTRDRRKHNPTMPDVPKGYTVVRAYRSENSRIWREYGVRRAQLIRDSEEQSFFQYSDLLSSKGWVTHGGALADRLKPEINEWYLFHGCSASAAENICTNDFRISRAGSSTGTLYGKGIYFSESITKADEYSKPNDAGEHTVILTRVVGGHAKYVDAIKPDPEDLVRSCIEGPYDSIIGDRRRTRGTYREFVFYDSENFYAEYIIHYRRDM